MGKEIDQLLAESQIAEIEQGLKDAKAKFPETEALTDIDEELQELKDSITSSEWSRIGILFGMLWHKLDTMIKHLDDSNTTLKNIETNIKRK